MKLTLKDLLRAQQAFAILINLKMVSQATMFRLKRLSKQITAFLEDYETQLQSLAQEHGTMDDKGNYTITPTPDNVTAYTSAVKDLQSVEVTIDCEQFQLFDLRARPEKGVSDDDGLDWVTPAILVDLDWLIKE